MDRTHDIDRNENAGRTETPEAGRKPVLELDVEVLEERIAPLEACCDFWGGSSLYLTY